MTTAFADYVAEQTARNTNQLNVVKYTWMLCDALRQNYIDTAIRGHKQYIQRDESVDYHKACIQDLQSGTSPVDYTIESGKKYHKIIMSNYDSRSVHAFIDKQTGAVLKPASWRGPAKGERYNLLIIKQREWLYENADWSGGYLYAK